MLRNFIVAAALLGCMATVPVSAQPVASSQSEMPAVKEVGEGQGKGGLMSGEKPFTLMVDENVGELIYTFDDETKELESIRAKRGVIFASEDMTLNSDEMEYQTLNSSLVATGKRVVVRMGEMIITCQVFKYNPETQEGEFLGHPIVYQRDKEGKVTETAGRIISVVNVNGKFQMRVGSGGGISTYVKSSGVQSQGSSGGLEKKTLAPGQKGAGITLNNNPSALATSPAAPGTKKASGNGSSGLIPAPNLNVEENAEAPQSSSSGSNKIDPENPSDVKKLTEEIPQ